jgi:valyl-tRNA synthetase
MSKSLGNSPDPLELIDRYGADGLRFGLMRIAPSGQDIRFDEKQIEEGRNFATKLWNVARFRQLHGPSVQAPRIDPARLSIYAVEILARLNETIDAVDSAYQEYQFNTIAQQLYDFVWSDFCDWFVEAGKTEILGVDPASKQSTLAVMDYVLSAILRLLHPYMPHITEELWSIFQFGKGTIQFAPLPEKIEIDPNDRRRTLVRAAYGIVQTGRNLRAEARIASNQKAKFVLRSVAAELEPEQPKIARLLNASEFVIEPNFRTGSGASVATTSVGELFLIAEVDRAAERDRLEKEIGRIEQELAAVKTKLENKSFLDRAPAPVVEEHRQRFRDFADQLAKLKSAREQL